MNVNRMLPVPRGPYRAIIMEPCDNSDLNAFQTLYFSLTFGHQNFSHCVSDKNKTIIYYKYAYDVANILDYHKFNQNVKLNLFEDQASKTIHPPLNTRNDARINLNHLNGKIIHESRLGIQARFQTFKQAALAQEELRAKFLTKFCYKSEVRIPIYDSMNYNNIPDYKKNPQNQSLDDKDMPTSTNTEFKPKLRNKVPIKKFTNCSEINHSINHSEETDDHLNTSQMDQETLHNQLLNMAEIYKALSNKCKQEFRNVFKELVNESEEIYNDDNVETANENREALTQTENYSFLANSTNLAVSKKQEPKLLRTKSSQNFVRINKFPESTDSSWETEECSINISNLF